MNLDSKTANLSAAWWLAAALTILPLLQFLPVDFDRVGPLFILAPALWAGRDWIFEAVQKILAGPRWICRCTMLAGVSVVASTILADQPAPAAVTSASWVMLAAAGLLAGRLLATVPSTHARLLRGLTFGTAIGALSTWALWLASGKDPSSILLYQHPRILGLHMLAGAIGSLALLQQPRTNGYTRAGEWIASALTWGGLLWSGGRAPMLAAAFAIGLWITYTSGPMRKNLISRGSILCIAGLALSAMMWTSQPELGWWHALIRTKIAVQAASTSVLTSTRTDFWREAARHALAAPWLGHGPDAYRFLTPKLDGQQPHNFLLQLWLDLGICGLLPVLVLISGTLIVCLHRAKAARKAGAGSDVLPWAALLVASLAAGMLDGVFYHVVAFLPAAIAFGRVLELATMKESTVNPAPVRPIATMVMGLAAAVLLFHAWLFDALTLAPPPASPASWAARCLRVFPSTTFGLWRWLDAWQESQPETSLAWAQWAGSHSPSASFFHTYAARCQLARGNRAGAEMELRAALAEAHWTVRPGIIKMLNNIESHPH